MSQNYNRDRHFNPDSNRPPYQTTNFQDRGPDFRPDSSGASPNQHSIQNIPHNSQVDVSMNMPMRNYGNNNSCNQNPNSFHFPNQTPQMSNYNVSNPNFYPNLNPQINRPIGPNPNAIFPFRNPNPQAMRPVSQRPFMDNASRFTNPPIPVPVRNTLDTAPIGNMQTSQHYSANCPQPFRNPGPANIERPRFNSPPMHSSGNYWNKTQDLRDPGNVGDTLSIENYHAANIKISKENSTETDKEWVRGWATTVQERLNSEKKRKTAPKLKIIDIQRKLLKYATLVHDLETSFNNLESKDSTDDEEFASFRNNAEASKKEIIELGNYFNDDQNLTKIKRMVARRRRKRLVARKAKKEKAARRKQIKKEWKEKEERIDEKMKQLREQEKNKINEDKMKKEADSILREVRTKQEEAKRMKQILQVLTKLREARIKKGEIHGYVASPKANAYFDKLNGEFDRLLKDQLKLYNTEEQTLKVMMEESMSIYPHLKDTPQTKPKTEEAQMQIYEILFGKKDADQNEFQSSFTAADESVEILVQRRSDWDKFLTAEDDPNGSAVPIPWVLPNESPQDDWKNLQKS